MTDVGLTRIAPLRAPLAVKVVGAQVLVLGGLGLLTQRSSISTWSIVGVVGALAAALLISLVLVIIALRPVHDLEQVAARVWKGDFGARVGASPVAGHDVIRIGTMLNTLLDGLVADRARMRTLTTDVLKAGDRERAALARELHDSTAQQMAAIMMQLGAMANECAGTELGGRLTFLRDSAEAVVDDIRTLSHTIHPRVLDDLGLVPALRHLGREVTRGTGVDLDLDLPRSTTLTPGAAASVLYRVAQEALQNAMRHGAPRRIAISLATNDHEATLEVRDDGRGFDPAALASDGRITMGLSTMRERVDLIDGRFDVRSAPGGGTSVRAVVSLDEHPALAGMRT